MPFVYGKEYDSVLEVNADFINFYDVISPVNPAEPRAKIMIRGKFKVYGRVLELDDKVILYEGFAVFNFMNLIFFLSVTEDNGIYDVLITALDESTWLQFKDEYSQMSPVYYRMLPIIDKLIKVRVP